MRLFRNIYSRFRNLILYGIIGCTTSIIDFSVFTCLSQYFGIYYLVSNFISVFSGITISFLLNRSYNFKVKDKAILRYVVFLFVGLGGLLLSSLILWIGIEILYLNSLLVKLVSIVFVAAFQFSLNKYVTFRISTNNIIEHQKAIKHD